MLAAVLRYGIVICGIYFNLPFSGNDAITFESIAWDYASSLSPFDILNKSSFSSSFNISIIISLLYYIFDREIAVPIFMNAICGLFIFYIAVTLIYEFCGRSLKDMNYTSLYIIALHPILLIDSGVILRENLVILFYLLAILNISRFIITKKNLFIMKFILFVLCASVFHSAMVLVMLGFMVYSMSLNITKNNLITRLVSIILFVSLFLLFFNVNFSKIGALQDIIDVDYLAYKQSVRPEASTEYLRNMLPKTYFDLVWQTPIRICFFLCTPFLWWIRDIPTLVAAIEGVLWAVCFFTLIGNIKIIWREHLFRCVFILNTIMILAFSYGTGNYGTALRHRTKLIIPFVVLAFTLKDQNKNRYSKFV